MNTLSGNTLVWCKPAIGPRLKQNTREIYETWSGLAGDELLQHLHDIRNRAWQYGPYPCIGQWMFLLPSISSFPEYPEILDRAREGATILDLGCCFAQDLRLLAANGVPTENMYATDISPDLWELGFDLFRDREKMKAKFVQADIFDPMSQLKQLNGKIDVIIACQFLHLFDLEKQTLVAKRIVEFSMPGSILIGYQRAQIETQEIERPWGTTFYHNTDTFQRMWEEVEHTTGTSWEVKTSLVDLREWGMEEEDVEWMPQGRKGINFVLKRSLED